MAEQDGGAQPGSGESGDVAGGSLPPVPPARARLVPTVELAERFAEELAKPHSHQLGACGRLRINYRTYKRWMAADEDDYPDYPELPEFQAIVTAALDEQRGLDVEDIAAGLKGLKGADVAKASALVNVHQFHHLNRFKRFYSQDDEPKRTEVELGNKDGKAFRTDNRTSHSLTEATRRSLVTNILGVPESLLDAGAKLNDPEGEE